MGTRLVSRSLLVAAALTCIWPAPARAGFDLLSLYQSRIENFSDVEYLSEDPRGAASWQGDRRVAETFFTVDHLFAGQEPTDPTIYEDVDWAKHTNVAGGVLWNVRVKEQSRVQLSLFHLFSGNDLKDRSRSRWEALHGARLSVGRWAEVTLGGLWKSAPPPVTAPGTAPSPRSLSASVYTEVNSPALFSNMDLLKEYVGDKLAPLSRFRYLFGYDLLLWVKSLDAGMLYYQQDRSRMVFETGFERLGWPGVGGLTAHVRLSPEGLVSGRGGIDLRFNSAEDRNLSRRGLYSSYLAVQAFAIYIDPSRASAMADVEQEKPFWGVEAALSTQLPMSEFMCRFMSIWGLLGQCGRSSVKQDVFVRSTLTYTYNDHDVVFLGRRVGPERHRLQLQVGVMY